MRGICWSETVTSHTIGVKCSELPNVVPRHVVSWERGGYNGELIRGDLSVGHEIESNFSLKIDSCFIVERAA